ncbi:MAG: hypothetical protein WBN40_10025, partial [Pseudomonadales bacterium]
MIAIALLNFGEYSMHYQKRYRLRANTSRLLTLCAAGICCVPVSALDYSAALRADSQYEGDGRLDGSSRSEVITRSGLDFTIGERNQYIDLRGNYRYDYEQYENDTNTNRSRISGNSDLVATIVAQRFNWLASHAVSETSPNRKEAADIADNQQRRQQFSTGPLLQLPLSSVDTLALNARYTEILFDKTEKAIPNTTTTDSSNTQAGLNWQRALSQISSLRVGYQYQDFERDNSSVSTEFQRIYAGLTRTLRTLNYSVSVGSNNSKREGQGSDSGLFYQASIERDDGAQKFSASATKQRTESSLGINNLQLDAAIADFDSSALSVSQSQENSGIEGSVDITFLNLDYSSTLNCKRCSYGIELSYIESEYDNVPSADDKVSSVVLHYDYRLTPHTTAVLST